jgi:ElaB/YqjD/DUF883 family membrane-anchored ribosome-binding protein
MDDTSRRVDDETRRAGVPAADAARGHEDPARPGGAEPEEPLYRVEVIRAEIEQTREDLSETIDAIQDRLRPGNIAAEATGRVKRATTERVKHMAHKAEETAHEMMEGTRDMAGRLTRSARENPLPAVLIGIGTAWLLMNRSGSTRTPRDRSRDRDTSRRSAEAYAVGPGEVYDYGAYGVYYDEEEREGIAERIMDKVRQHPVPAALAGVGLAWLAFANGHDRSGDEYDYGYEYEGTYGTGYGTARSSRAAQSLRGAYDETAAGVSEAASGLVEGTGEAASRARHYAGDAADEIRWRGRRAQNQLQRMLYENPLMVGAAAVVIGAAVGMALPETDREREWMGETRDNLVDRAQEMAKDAASRVQDAAGDVAGDIASRAVTGKDD